MDQLNHLPRNPLLRIPKPLLQFLVLLEIIDYGLSAVLFRLGLYPSFATQPSPWDYHNSRGSIPLATSSPPPPVSASVIKKQLRTVAYSRFRNGDEEPKSTCSVCLHGLEASDAVRELGNCRHAFHERCIDAWVDTGKVTCPLCRMQLLSAEGTKEGIRCTTNHVKEELSYVMLHGHGHDNGETIYLCSIYDHI